MIIWGRMMGGVTVNDTPTYLTYQLPPPPPRPDPRRRRLLTAMVAGWAVVLVVLGIWYSLQGKPTVKEQTTIAQAQSTVDRAIGQVVTAAGSGVVPAVGGYQKVADCEINPTRSGARYARELYLYTAPGSEPALLDRVAAGLPAGYHAKAQHPTTGNKDTLAADAGDYVAIDGTLAQPGAVRIVANTGCRPLGHAPAADPTALPDEADRAPVQGLLTSLGVSSAAWSTHQLPCGLRTVEATSSPDQTAGTPPKPATPAVVSTDSLYADATGTAARISGGRAVVTFTSGTCR
jgi:hypothetical protein